MKTKQQMTRDPQLMHKRITELCQYLNTNLVTNYNVASEKFKIAKWHFVVMQKCGIIWKEENIWKGAERLTQQRLDKFVELSKAYHKRFYKKEIKQCEIKFPKSTPQVTPQVTHPVAKKNKTIAQSIINQKNQIFIYRQIMKTDFQQLIKSNFKNTLNFGRVIGVSYPTAWRYVNYPAYMRLMDIQKLSDELKIDIKIIVQMAINSSAITIKDEGDE